MTKYKNSPVEFALSVDEDVPAAVSLKLRGGNKKNKDSAKLSIFWEASSGCGCLLKTTLEERQ